VLTVGFNPWRLRLQLLLHSSCLWWRQSVIWRKILVVSVLYHSLCSLFTVHTQLNS